MGIYHYAANDKRREFLDVGNYDLNVKWPALVEACARIAWPDGDFRLLNDGAQDDEIDDLRTRYRSIDLLILNVPVLVRKAQARDLAAGGYWWPGAVSDS